jgi:hypothetical protein
LDHVASLAQKICIIADNLVIGWAGDYLSATRIISAMRNYPWPADIELQNIQDFLAGTAYDDQSSIQMVGLCIAGSTCGEFGLNVSEVDIPVFNKSRIAGSGRERFIAISQASDGFKSFGDGAVIEISPFTRFIKVKYEDDILIIRRVDFVQNRRANQDIIVLGPVGRPSWRDCLDSIKISP